MKVVMIGTGYVGLVSGTCLSEVGHHVSCVDLNQSKVDMLRDGRSPIYEPGLEAMIRRNMEHDRLNFTTDLTSCIDDCDMVFIAVGTPEGEDGSADLGHVVAVAKSLGEQLTKKAIVVVKSTVPVSTCDMVERTITEGLKNRGLNFGVTVASNPEFLKEGDAIVDFMKPDRIVVGLNDSAAERDFVELYKPFVLDDPGRLVFMDRRSSELTKYAANAMLATRISFMNELAIMCEKLGANVDMVRHGMGKDPRIGKKFLFPGPGYGGSCFPKDVAALRKMAQRLDMSFNVLDSVAEANDKQKQWASQKVLDGMGDPAGKTVAVWGLAFKPGTDDVRETPAADVIDALLKRGAKVVAHDPKAQENFSKDFGGHELLSFADDAYQALNGAHALVLVTEWSEYRRPNWDKVAELMDERSVFDLRNQYDARDLMKRDFYYESIGRPNPATID